VVIMTITIRTEALIIALNYAIGERTKEEVKRHVPGEGLKSKTLLQWEILREVLYSADDTITINSK
jgi:hypothetical protein